MSLTARRALVDPTHSASIRQQCQWLSLPRSSYYYQPRVASPDDLLLMRLLDEQYLLTPQFGYRKMALFLREQGHIVNHKRVLRLMQVMGLETIYPKPNTSRPAVGHTVYPYLLRQLSVNRVHQVWATDITYVPMADGYMYLMAIIDLHSRYVLVWSVSNTMDAAWCTELLQQALATYPAPDIFNTDQGSQFTSETFTTTLKAANVRISMDGKGRALDNIFVERLWRTVKYEHLYLYAYADGWQLEQGLSEFFTFYNQRRYHQALAYRTPEQVFQAAQVQENQVGKSIN
jgi:putative transposase